MNLIGYILSRPRVANWIIARAQKTEYFHLEGYMNRWWLFNGYEPGSHTPKRPWLPISIRVHHILRKDADRHMHDHPWNARTFILKGWYIEEREAYLNLSGGSIPVPGKKVRIGRFAGDTAALRFGEYHTIKAVSSEGVYTLFIVGRMRGMWGFKVNGAKVPYKEYLACTCGNPDAPGVVHRKDGPCYVVANEGNVEIDKTVVEYDSYGQRHEFPKL